MHSQINAATRKVVKVPETSQAARDEREMAGKLTRGKVVAEIDELKRQATLLEARIEKLTDAGVIFEREEFDEWFRYIETARRLTRDNQMDFREIDAALLELRQSRSSFDSTLGEAELQIKMRNNAPNQ